MRPVLSLLTHILVLGGASWHSKAAPREFAKRASGYIGSSFLEKSRSAFVPESVVMDGVAELRGVLNGAETHEHDEPQLFLEFDVLGDLTNVRECIVNAAILCHSLGLTLVLPSSYKSTYRSINLAEVYDLDHFQASLSEAGIQVVRQSPTNGARYKLSIPSDIPLKTNRFQYVIDALRPNVDRHKGEYATFYAAGVSDELNIGFHVFESRYVSACKADMPICGHIQGSLVHSEPIRQKANTIVDAMRAQSHEWTALHLHDFQPFLCGQSTEKELFFASKMLNAAKWQSGPLYLVSGRHDLKHVAASLQGWKLMDKWTIMNTSAFEFQYGAAVDFEVALQAPRYIGKRGSSFDTLAVELRRASDPKSGHVLYLPQNPCPENFEREVANVRL